MSTTQSVDPGRSWRLLRVSIFLGPIIGLASVASVFAIVGIVRQQPHVEPLWLGSLFFTYGLFFTHVIGIVPAAISAGLNILIATAVTSRLGRQLAAPFMGAVAGAVFFPLIGGANPLLGVVVAMIGVSAFSSWACVAIVDRKRPSAYVEHSAIRRPE